MSSSTATFPPSWGGRLPADPERVIDAALDLRDAGAPGQAEALLRAGLAAHPRHARLWQTLGVLLRAREDSEAATEAFGTAARLAPADLRIAHSLAQASFEAGFPAVHLFDRARRLAPADGDLLTGRAAAQLAEGDGAQAIADLQTVLANNPLWLAGHEALAHIRWLTGDHADAFASYRAALAAAPRSLDLRRAFVDLLLQTGRHAEADAAIAEARAATGDGFEVYEAVAASELGDHDRAGRLFARIAAVPELADQVPVAVRHVRHLLRTHRFEAAAARAEPLLGHADADQLWPYAALAWRLVGDPRWHWLQAGDRLVGIYDLADALPLDALVGVLRRLHGAASYPIGQSVRDGTQTDGPLFARAEPEIRALRGVISQAVERHVAGLGAPDPAHPVLRHIGPGVRFAGSWSVRLTGGAAHHTNHIHPRGWLSSACYMVVPPEAEMGAAPAGHLAFGQAPAELGLDLPPVGLVEPRPGRLVLFPSIMWHGTMPFAGGERLSVAFDVARPPRAQAGRARS